MVVKGKLNFRVSDNDDFDGRDEVVILADNTSTAYLLAELTVKAPVNYEGRHDN